MSEEKNENEETQGEPKSSPSEPEKATVPCPECRGSGVIALLVTSRPCARCGGTGSASRLIEAAAGRKRPICFVVPPQRLVAWSRFVAPPRIWAISGPPPLPMSLETEPTLDRAGGANAGAGGPGGGTGDPHDAGTGEFTEVFRRTYDAQGRLTSETIFGGVEVTTYLLSDTDTDDEDGPSDAGPDGEK